MITLFNCSSEKMFETLGAQCVKVSVQSPPYKEVDGYGNSIMSVVANELYHVHKDDSVCFLNFGDLAGQASRPFKVVELFERVGFELMQTIFWIKSVDGKGHFTPINSDRRLNNGGEYVFMFAKGSPKLKRLKIGVPYTDKSNIARFGHKQDLRCRGNVWYIPYQTHQSQSEKLHLNRFPIELVKRCLLLGGVRKGCLVADAFAGGATTCKVAEMLGVNSVGFELSRRVYNKTIKSLQPAFEVASTRDKCVTLKRKRKSS